MTDYPYSQFTERDRSVPLARSTNWLSILKVFAVFAFGAFVLGFVCVFGWSVL